MLSDDLDLRRLLALRAIESGFLRLKWLAAATRFEIAMHRHDRALRRALKYRPDQPRVPRGNADGGQWTREGGGVNGGRSPGSSNRNSGRENQQLAQLFPFLLSEPPVVPRPVIEPPTEPGPVIEPPIEPGPVIKPPLEEWPTDPTKAPPGYEWRGQPGSTPGDGKGSYVKPKEPGAAEPETLRYDNSPGHNPHWDYRAPDGKLYRWYPDGTMEPKGIILFHSVA